MKEETESHHSKLCYFPNKKKFWTQTVLKETFWALRELQWTLIGFPALQMSSVALGSVSLPAKLL